VYRGVFARSPKATRGRNRERKKRESGRDNLATKGFTARNHHSVWKFEFYFVDGVRYRPDRRPLMKLQPPLCSRENFFFFHNGKYEPKGSFRAFTTSGFGSRIRRRWFHFDSKDFLVLSWRKVDEWVDYIYRLPANTWRGWLRLVKLAISVISARCKFRYGLFRDRFALCTTLHNTPQL